MRTKNALFYAAILLFTGRLLLAQVSGVVNDADGFPDEGAIVTVKGTNVSTETDGDGSFTIDANIGDVLEIESSDLSGNWEVDVTSNNLGTLSNENISLGEVVVVGSFGRTLEQKSLGYANSQVDGELINELPQPDIGRILQGKASGLQINSTGGTAGSGTNVVIRGQSSLLGNNQALWIVDGVFFNSSTSPQDTFVNGGQTTPSRFLDIDPNNIEDVTVLKGLAATNLYGEAGRNGVILVTTKTGSSGKAKQGLEVTISQGLFIEQIASIPDYQDVYGGGFQQNFGFFFSNYGPAFSDGVNPNNSLYRGEGPNGFSLTAHPYDRASLNAAFPEFIGATYEYRPYDSVGDFFETGYTSNTSINLQGSNGTTSFGANLSYTDQESFLPNNELQRFVGSIAGRSELSNRVTFSANLNYSKTDVKTPPLGAGNGSGVVGVTGISAFSDLFYTPRNIDLNGLPFEDPATGTPVYYRSSDDILNPRWVINNATDLNLNNHIWGGANIKYSFTDDISVSYQPSIDLNFERQEFRLNPTGNFFGNTLDNGYFRETRSEAYIYNHLLVLNWDIDRLFSDNLGLKITAGGQARRDEFDQTGIEATGAIVRNRWHASNFTTVANGGIRFVAGSQDFESSFNTLGVFAEGVFNFKDYLFATISVRNDWTSILEGDNRSQFYPAASVSFVPTDAFDNFGGSTLNFLKLRFGYGTSAGFGNVFQTRNNLFQDVGANGGTQGGTVTQSSGNTLGNPDLKPELYEEYEAGVEAGFLRNRINLNASVYYRTVTDQIIQTPIAQSTGFSDFSINAGEVVVKGVEIDLDVTPIKTKDFKWTMLNRFNAFENTLEEGFLGIDNITIAGGFGFLTTGLGNYAVEGEALGVIRGTRILRDANGTPIVNSLGYYQQDPSGIGIIGDPNPDWTLTNINNFSYKGFNLSMQWDYISGGDIFSQTAASLLQRGLIEETAIDRDQLYVLPGVLADGSPNNIQITATNYFFNYYTGGANITGTLQENAIFDGSFVRLRNISLSYSLPKSFIDKTPFGNIVITATADNVWYKALNFPDGVNFDVDVASTGVGNGRGLDFLTTASSRRYGMSVRITF